MTQYLSPADKLTDCWPCFDESQMVFFSTHRAHRDVMADQMYINDNFRHLLDAVKELYITAIERRIKLAYKYGLLLCLCISNYKRVNENFCNIRHYKLSTPQSL